MNSSTKPYYVYILRCSDDSLYTGVTPDIKKRMMAHCGKIKGGAKYTKSHPVVKIETAWKTEDRSNALRMECAVKKLSRREKLHLIAEPCELFGEYFSEVCERNFLDDIMRQCLKNE